MFVCHKPPHTIQRLRSLLIDLFKRQTAFNSPNEICPLITIKPTCFVPSARRPRRAARRLKPPSLPFFFASLLPCR